jgi:hydrogenase/urease accessory protein HupE
VPQVVYFLCAALLWRAYRKGRARLLLWSSLAFVGFAANNALVFVDLVMVPDIDLSVPRTLVALAAVMVLLFGLVWDSAG